MFRVPCINQIYNFYLKKYQQMDLNVIILVHSLAFVGLFFFLILYILCHIYPEAKQGILLWQVGTWEVRFSGYYAARRCNFFPTFSDNLLVSSSVVNNPQIELDSGPLRFGPISCPEKLVRNYNCALRGNTKEHSSYPFRARKLKFRKLAAICQISKLTTSHPRRY